MSDPNAPFQTYDQRFEAVLGHAACLHHVVATDAHEGPVYAAAENALYFTTAGGDDAAQVASTNVSIDKARTAAIYRRPSKDFEHQASSGRPSALHLASAIPLPGGMPILHDGEIIGGVGVSGASSADEDQELAEKSAVALNASRGRQTGAEAARLDR